jgi:hypothetical protein
MGPNGGTVAMEAEEEMYTVKKVNNFAVPGWDVRFWPGIILN